MKKKVLLIFTLLCVCFDFFFLKILEISFNDFYVCSNCKKCNEYIANKNEEKRGICADCNCDVLFHLKNIDDENDSFEEEEEFEDDY